MKPFTEEDKERFRLKELGIYLFTDEDAKLWKSMIEMETYAQNNDWFWE